MNRIFQIKKLIKLRLALLTLAAFISSCTSDADQLHDRSCKSQSECPERRICLEGACIVPDSKPIKICRGDVLVSLDVYCDDYLCTSPSVEEISRVDCSQPKASKCQGDTLITYDPGSCDSEIGECKYREDKRIKCDFKYGTCDGDLLQMEIGNGCIKEEQRCDSNLETIDCKDQSYEPYCDPSDDQSRFLLIPSTDEVGILCDPERRECLVPEYTYFDCSEEKWTCEGNVAVLNEGGVCSTGSCDYSNINEIERIDCSRETLKNCDGNILVSKNEGVCVEGIGCQYSNTIAIDCSEDTHECNSGSSIKQIGGICEPLTRSCVYPDTVAEDCSGTLNPICRKDLSDQDALRGDDQVIINYSSGRCEPETGKCVYPYTLKDCGADVNVCNGSISRHQSEGECFSGQCRYSITEDVDCEDRPPNQCQDSVAVNYDRGGICNPETGGCEYGESLHKTFCFTESFCQGNVFVDVRSDENICRINESNVAECDYSEARTVDCNSEQSPHCIDDNILVSYSESGVCFADTGCDSEASRVETQCARCSGADCILPEFIYVEAPGAFFLGEERILVEIDESYVMAATELTRAQLARLVEETDLPSEILDGLEVECVLDECLEDGCTLEDCPAEGLSFYDAIAIANAWSEREGLPPCYDPLGNVIGGLDGNPYLCEGYRLPTEAEWEFAYRAGLSSAWYCGDNQGCVEAIGWIDADVGARPVRGRTPNLAGFHDMAGNAREWVHDLFSEEPQGGVSYHGPSHGDARTLKGGSWATGAAEARFFARQSARPEESAQTGVRLVRSLAPWAPVECEFDEQFEVGVRISHTSRSHCALTQGVPCVDFLSSEYCEGACVRGVCAPAPRIELRRIDDDVLHRPLTFIPVPAGRFAQGGLATLHRSEGQEWTQTTTLTHDFWLAETELTYEQAYALIPGFVHFEGGFPQEAVEIIDGQVLDCGDDRARCAKYPLLALTFDKAILLANALSALEGLAPCYNDDANAGLIGAVIGGGETQNPYLCEGYRLPTEAEWEYAYRAGSDDPFYCGDVSCVNGIAWHSENASLPVIPGAEVVTDPDETWLPNDCPCIGILCPFTVDNGQSCQMPHRVASKAPNAWGLYDMAGNLSEWVHDWTPYERAVVEGEEVLVVDPPPVAPRDPYRNRADDLYPVVRGNSAFHPPESHRAAARRAFEIKPEIDYVSMIQLSTHGLRLARTIPTQIPTMIPLDAPGALGGLTLNHDFEIAQTEVTQAQYKALLFDTPSRFRDVEGCDDCPVEQVSWLDATRYANALSRRMGLSACYSDEGEVLGVAGGSPYLCEGYRLPTEAEWEYAYRGGAEGDWHCVGDADGSACGACVEAPDAVGQIAKYLCNSIRDTPNCSCPSGLGELPGDLCGIGSPGISGDHCSTINTDNRSYCFTTRPVGAPSGDPNAVAVAPNCFGLYDMAGSVREWVHDIHDPQAPPSGVDPWGPSRDRAPECIGGQICRGVRGGGWANRPENLTATARDNALPSTRNLDLGFRIARTLHD